MDSSELTYAVTLRIIVPVEDEDEALYLIDQPEDYLSENKLVDLAHAEVVDVKWVP